MYAALNGPQKCGAKQMQDTGDSVIVALRLVMRRSRVTYRACLSGVSAWENPGLTYAAPWRRHGG